MNSRALVGIIFSAIAAFTVSGQTVDPDLRPQIAPDRDLVDPKKNPEREIRRHWSTVRPDGTILHELTTINRSSEEASVTIAVVRDAKGQTWLFEDVNDYSRRAVRYQITHLPTGEYVSLGFKSPFDANTRADFIRQASVQGRDADVELTVATRLASRTAMESVWEDVNKSADWRSDIRTSLSTSFLDALEQMRDTLLRHDPDFSSFAGLAKSLSYAPECEPAARASTVERMWPDCGFDKDLGRPCSKEQLGRVERARKKGVIPVAY